MSVYRSENCLYRPSTLCSSISGVARTAKKSAIYHQTNASSTYFTLGVAGCILLRLEESYFGCCET
jgi:hypothetical protein